MVKIAILMIVLDTLVHGACAIGMLMLECEGANWSNDTVLFPLTSLEG